MPKPDSREKTHGGKRLPNRIRFTEAGLARLKVKHGRKTWSNKDFHALKILVSHTGLKKYQLITKLNGLQVKENLKVEGQDCEFPDVHPNKALKIAAARIDELRESHPDNGRIEKSATSMTAEEVVEEYLSIAQARRKHALKVSAATEYRRSLKKLLGDKWTQPITKISEANVKTWHLAQVPVSSLRYLNAVFNFWCKLHKVTKNPMRILSTLDPKWSATSPKSKSSLVLPSKKKGTKGNLPEWYAAVQKLREPTITKARNHALEVHADIFECLLFLGCRKGDLIGDSRAKREPLRWHHVDLDYGAISYLDTKNQSSPTVPICDHVLGILKRRRALDNGEWVFTNSHTGDPVRSLSEGVKKVQEDCGIEWTCKHNRDTFAAFARRHNDLIRKLLSNHAAGTDITDQYALAGGSDDLADDLVDARNEISNRIREAVGLPSLNVVDIRAA